MGPPGGGRSVISERLQSRFNIVNFTFPSEKAVKTIFESILAPRYADFNDDVKRLVPGIVAATTTSITVAVPYAMGIYCSSSTATFVPVDSLIAATAVFRGYAYRDTAINASYTYVGSTTAPTATCR